MKKPSRAESLSGGSRTVEHILAYFIDKLSLADTMQLVRLEAFYVALEGYVSLFGTAGTIPEGVFNPTDRLKLIKAIAENIKDLPPWSWDTLIAEGVRLMGLSWSGQAQVAVNEIRAIREKITGLYQAEGRQLPTDSISPDEKNHIR